MDFLKIEWPVLISNQHSILAKILRRDNETYGECVGKVCYNSKKKCQIRDAFGLASFEIHYDLRKTTSEIENG